MGKVTRRDFIVKGGKYTLFTASAMQVLFTSNRAMAQSGLAQFVVGLKGGHKGGALSGWPSTSPSGSWASSGFQTQYESYTISFTGNTAHLPSIVDVLVTWDGSSFHSTGNFEWDDQNGNSGNHTFHVPKATGLTIGGGNAGVANNAPFALNQDASSRTGTVLFTATGVQPLTISVHMGGNT